MFSSGRVSRRVTHVLLEPVCCLSYRDICQGEVEIPLLSNQPFLFGIHGTFRKNIIRNNTRAIVLYLLCSLIQSKKFIIIHYVTFVVE